MTAPTDALRYAIAEVREHYDDPLWWKRRFRHRVVSDLYYGRVVGNDGTYVMAEDWDVLLLLDACRYDLLAAVLAEAYPDRLGALESRRSRGSSTPEFVQENFAGRSFPDTVYVTANPYVDVHAGGAFHAVYSLWDTAWSEDHQTVLPADVVDPAVEAARSHPDKRVIVHFMQPHQPFVGYDFGDGPMYWNRVREAARDETATAAYGASIWDLLERGAVDADRVWAAYRDNLERALPHAFEIAASVTGKPVVTSDHGNAFGERASPFPLSIYGHPRGVRIDPLVRVPWLALPHEERRDVAAGETTGTTDAREDDEAVADRLEALGYVE